MRRCLLLAFLTLCVTSLAPAQTIYEIELRGDARLLSKDRPVQRGRLALFHRYPDGLFTSIPEEEIVRIETTEVSAKSKTLKPGETIELGPTGGSRAREASALPGATAATGLGSFGPMNQGLYWFGRPRVFPPASAMQSAPGAPPAGVPSGPPPTGIPRRPRP